MWHACAKDRHEGSTGCQPTGDKSNFNVMWWEFFRRFWKKQQLGNLVITYTDQSQVNEFLNPKVFFSIVHRCILRSAWDPVTLLNTCCCICINPFRAHEWVAEWNCRITAAFWQWRAETAAHCIAVSYSLSLATNARCCHLCLSTDLYVVLYILFRLPPAGAHPKAAHALEPNCSGSSAEIKTIKDVRLKLQFTLHNKIGADVSLHILSIHYKSNIYCCNLLF